MMVAALVAIGLPGHLLVVGVLGHWHRVAPHLVVVACALLGWVARVRPGTGGGVIVPSNGWHP